MAYDPVTGELIEEKVPATTKPNPRADAPTAPPGPDANLNKQPAKPNTQGGPGGVSTTPKGKVIDPTTGKLKNAPAPSRTTSERPIGGGRLQTTVTSASGHKSVETHKDFEGNPVYEVQRKYEKKDYGPTAKTESIGAEGAGDITNATQTAGGVRATPPTDEERVQQYEKAMDDRIEGVQSKWEKAVESGDKEKAEVLLNQWRSMKEEKKRRMQYADKGERYISKEAQDWKDKQQDEKDRRAERDKAEEGLTAYQIMQRRRATEGTTKAQDSMKEQGVRTTMRQKGMVPVEGKTNTWRHASQAEIDRREKTTPYQQAVDAEWSATLSRNQDELATATSYKDYILKMDDINESMGEASREFQGTHRDQDGSETKYYKFLNGSSIPSINLAPDVIEAMPPHVRREYDKLKSQVDADKKLRYEKAKIIAEVTARAEGNEEALDTVMRTEQERRRKELDFNRDKGVGGGVDVRKGEAEVEQEDKDYKEELERKSRETTRDDRRKDMTEEAKLEQDIENMKDDMESQADIDRRISQLEDKTLADYLEKKMDIQTKIDLAESEEELAQYQKELRYASDLKNVPMEARIQYEKDEAIRKLEGGLSKEDQRRSKHYREKYTEADKMRKEASDRYQKMVDENREFISSKGKRGRSYNAEELQKARDKRDKAIATMKAYGNAYNKIEGIEAGKSDIKGMDGPKRNKDGYPVDSSGQPITGGEPDGSHWPTSKEAQKLKDKYYDKLGDLGDKGGKAYNEALLDLDKLWNGKGIEPPHRAMDYKDPDPDRFEIEIDEVETTTPAPGSPAVPTKPSTKGDTKAIVGRKAQKIVAQHQEAPLTDEELKSVSKQITMWVTAGVMTKEEAMALGQELGFGPGDK